MANANIAIIAVTNTFDDWRTRTNDLVSDRNILRNHPYVKDNSNFTVSNGTVLISRSTGGTLLTLSGSGDALIGGTTTTTDLIVGDDASVANQLSVTGNTIITGNLSVGTNSTFTQNVTVSGTANVTLDLKITGNTTLQSNLTVSKNATITQNATVTGTLNVTGDTALTSNLTVTANTTLSSNLSVSKNVAVSQNATISGTLTATGNVTGGNLSTANKVLGSTLESTVATGTAPLTVASTTKVTNLNADLLDGYDSSGSATPATIALRTGDGSLIANLLYGTLATAAQPNVTSLGTLSTLGVTGNTTLSSNLAISSNTTVSQNLIVTGTANLNGKTTATNMVLDTLGSYTINQGNAVFNNVTINGTQVNLQPILTDSDLLVLRASTITDGNATLRSRRAGLGNAEIRFLSTSDVWQATANANLAYSTLLTTGNIVTTVTSTSTTDAASPSAVKTANDTAVAAANTVRVSGNSVSTLHGVSLNFTNTASINIAVTSGVAGNANVAFSSNTSNPAALGPQGVQGAVGAQGFQGAVGAQGAAGGAGAQGAAGGAGAQGAAGGAGAQGAQGFQGAAGGAGAQGAAGTNGAQGAAGSNGGTGAQGVQGAAGSNGGTGAQGVQGAAGAAGAQGAAGAAGAQGAAGVGAQGVAVNYSSIGVNTAAGSTGEIRATGDITAYYSDMRLKKYLGQIEHALLKLNGIQGFYYTGNEEAGRLGYSTDRREVGVSAQDVEKVLPEIIKPAPIDERYMTLDYAKIVPLLIEAVKELNTKVDALQDSLRNN